jgi:hypothetical protein
MQQLTSNTSCKHTVTHVVSTDASVALLVASVVQNVEPGTCACVTNVAAVHSDTTHHTRAQNGRQISDDTLQLHAINVYSSMMPSINQDQNRRDTKMTSTDLMDHPCHQV